MTLAVSDSVATVRRKLVSLVMPVRMGAGQAGPVRAQLRDCREASVVKLSLSAG